MLDLDGAQMGSLQCALVKLTPRAASRSKLGVGTRGLLAGCKGISFRSSTMMNRTFGRVDSGLNPVLPFTEEAR